MQLDHIYQGDCRDILASLPPNSVDLIFADPPYNLQLQQELWRPNQTKVDAVDDAWDQFSSFAAYDEFTRDWLSACRRVLKDTGTIWVIGSYHNIYRVGSILQDLGFWFLNDVVWVKCLAGNTELFCLINGRPIVTTLKDLARISPTTNSIKVPSYDEQGCFTWIDLVATQHTPKSRGLRIELEDGSAVECTEDHQFPVARNGYIDFVPADQLSPDDKLLQLRRFDMPQAIESTGIDEALGEFIGWYLAEGSLLDDEDGLQLAMHANELPQAQQLIARIQQRFGVVGRTHIYKNTLHLVFSSRFLVALMQRFVRGHGAHEKRLAREAFLYGVAFLRGVLSGYLQGDGHWDRKQQRWRLGLCRNEGLITDLGVICRLLGQRLRFSQGFVPYQRRQAAIIRGEIRENMAGSWSFASLEDLGLPSRRFFRYGQQDSIANLRSNYKLITRKRPVGLMTQLGAYVMQGDVQPLKIRAIRQGTLRSFYDVAVSANHVFALANGLLTHNSNPMPNFRGMRFTNAHETLLWCKKSQDQKKYTFNYHAMKQFNDEKQMRSDWQIPICTGSERIKVDGVKAHATQKPEALLYRVILASSNPGDVILDPFFGSGTTGAVAKKLNRRYIGIEREAQYIAVAQERIAAIQPARDDAEVYGHYTTRRSAPRLPFSALIEYGILVPGQTLYFRQTQPATVLADGSLRTPEGVRGSIHKLGAILDRAATCNGWMHWYYQDETGAYLPIDVLREQIRRITTQTAANE